MDTFKYEALDKNGKKVRGVMDAPCQEIVVKRLREMGYSPLKVTMARGGKPEMAGLRDLDRMQSTDEPDQIREEKIREMEDFLYRAGSGDREALDRITLFRLGPSTLISPPNPPQKGFLHVTGVKNIPLFFVGDTPVGERILQIGNACGMKNVSLKGLFVKKLILTDPYKRETEIRFPPLSTPRGLMRAMKIIRYERERARARERNS